MRNYDLTINDKAISVKVLELSAEMAELEVNGKTMTIAIDGVRENVPQGAVLRPVRSVSSSASVNAPAQAGAAQASSGAGSVKAPIPGAILSVYVKLGDKVQAGQPLFKMEAMKMENEINAHLDGTVTAIHVGAGDSVNQGQELMVVAPAAALKNRRASDQ